MAIGARGREAEEEEGAKPFCRINNNEAKIYKYWRRDNIMAAVAVAAAAGRARRAGAHSARSVRCYKNVINVFYN